MMLRLLKCLVFVCESLLGTGWCSMRHIYPGPSAQGQIAVIFEVAGSVEIASLIVQAYDLSKHEGEIMQSVLRGLSTSEMADTFHISSHTVQDHLKAIFGKVGVRSRRELVGQLFAQQYQQHLASGRDVDANGWFT
jgi:DNA-binding CsgD family transcriptional regulator